MVSAVEPVSPAEAAGLRVGDVVFAVGDVPVRSRGALARLVSESGVENAIELRLMRWGTELVVEPRVSRHPEDADLDELSLEADEDDPEIIEQEVLEIEAQGPED